MAFCKWGFVGFLLADFFLLFLIGAALCFLPALIRFAFDAISGQIEGKKPFSVREMPQRWTCDVYEVGISTPGTSSPSFLFDKSSPSEGACFRFLAYVFLFLLLDLEASLFLPLLLSNGHVFLLLGFFAFLLLSFGLAFTTLHF